MRHIFIVGAKGFTYGGYETFLDKMTEYHQVNKEIQYHIACKANGQGITDETKLPDAKILSDKEYIYHNAHCFKIKSPEIGTAQAILYDIKAMQYCCNYIKKNNIENPIVYVLSSRIGFAMGYFSNIIHSIGGKIYHNPDGRENLRRKYKFYVRLYWKMSERLHVKHSDLEICDSINIEKYIRDEYKCYTPKTTYIAYGADVVPSDLEDTDPKFINWMNKNGLERGKYYVSVGRFVPENNFEIMIREFMKSKTKKDFAIITTNNSEFYKSLDDKLHFSHDKRIKFVGTVYEQDLLKKIRENAWGYFHGHEVGGTNPSLLEALASTNINMLLDVGFNNEVALDAALYWTKEDGNLAALIEKVDNFDLEKVNKYGEYAKQRIREAYSWEKICNQYAVEFLK